MKIAIAVPTAGDIKTKTAACIIAAIKELPYEFVFITKESSLVHYNREVLVKTAIERGCSHILFVDSDMSFEPKAVQTLIERDKDIVGVHYRRKTTQLFTTVVMDLEKKKNLKETFTECEAVGTGFLLIKCDVFAKLSHPWFFYEVDSDGETQRGEDYWFCKKAREAGFIIWVDLTIPVKHIGNYEY